LVNADLPTLGKNSLRLLDRDPAVQRGSRASET